MLFCIFCPIISTNALIVAKTYALKSSTLHIESASTQGDLFVLMAKSHISNRYLNFENIGNFSCSLIPKLKGRDLQARLLINGNGEYCFPRFGYYSVVIISCNSSIQLNSSSKFKINVHHPIFNYTIFVSIEFLVLFFTLYYFKSKTVNNNSDKIMIKLKKNFLFTMFADMFWIAFVSLMLNTSKEDAKKYMNYHRYLRFIAFMNSAIFVGSGVPSVLEYSDKSRYFGLIFASLLALISRYKEMTYAIVPFLTIYIAYQKKVYNRTRKSIKINKASLEQETLKSLKDVDYFRRSLSITKIYMKKSVFFSSSVICLEFLSTVLKENNTVCAFSICTQILFYFSILPSISIGEGVLNTGFVDGNPKVSVM